MLENLDEFVNLGSKRLEPFFQMVNLGYQISRQSKISATLCDVTEPNFGKMATYFFHAISFVKIKNKRYLDGGMGLKLFTPKSAQITS